MLTTTLLALGLAPWPQASSPPAQDAPSLQGVVACPFDRAVTIELSAGSASVESTIEFSGAVHVWTRAAPELELTLRVESLDGRLLAESGEAGGTTAAYVRLAVERGDELRSTVTLAAGSGQPAGADFLQLELHVVAAPESDVTLEQGDLAAAELAGIVELRQGGDLDAARARLRALIVRLGEVEGAATSDALAQRSWDAGFAAYSLGLPAAAASAWRRALAQRERTLPEDHADLLKARLNTASAIFSTGGFQEALPLYAAVEATYASTLPPEHPHLLSARLNLATTLMKLGRLEQARTQLELVLEARVRSLPADHVDLQRTRLNLSMLLFSLGDLTEARALQEQVLATFVHTPPEEHPELQTGAQSSLAITLAALGDLPAARALQEQVLEACAETLPGEHFELQAARVNLASTLNAMGELEAARALEQAAANALASTLRADHPELNRVRLNLGSTLYRLGDLAGARALFEDLLQSARRTLAEDDRILQAALANLSSTLRDQGELEGARSLQEELLAIRQRTLPEGHPALQRARLNLAGTLASQAARASIAGSGSTPQAPHFAALSRDLLRGATVAWRTALFEASPREAEERVAHSPDLDAALSMASGWGVFERDPRLEADAFLLSERTRNVALLSAHLARAARSDPAWEGLRQQARSASAQLADLLQRGGSSDEFARVRAELDQAQGELVRLGTRVDAGLTTVLDADVARLGSRLGADEALVAYRRYRRATVDSTGHESALDCLGAFVLRRGGWLQRVEFGPIAPIEAAVADWRRSLGLGGEVVATRGAAPPGPQASSGSDDGELLRRCAFDPLLEALEGVDRICVAWDDVLHLVPFDALPAGDVWGGRASTGPAGAGLEMRLGDVLRIESRSSLLEVLLEQRPPRAQGQVLLIGAVSYAAAPDASPGVDVRSGAPRGAELAGVLRGGAFETGFAPLPATGAEVQGIRSAGADLGSGRIFVLLEGAQATRASLERLAPRARWLHVATHGWFAAESIRSWVDVRPLQFDGHDVRLDSAGRVRGLSPMLLCGIALAGANLPADERGRLPGLVTAEELATLDLHDCELAVLSACDTNVGLQRAGQGVASLQKALHMAGARSVITSLWRVPDQATMELMVDFYRRTWVGGASKHQALWEAKRRLRDARDEHGRALYSPRDWAGWVLSGEID